MQYVGTTGRMLRQRRQGHRTEVKEWAKGVWEHQGRSLGLHFNNSEAGCKIENTELQVIALEERRGRRLELESGFINLLRPGINGVLLSPMATVDTSQLRITEVSSRSASVQDPLPPKQEGIPAKPRKRAAEEDEENGEC
jgi:hypothetical protein